MLETSFPRVTGKKQINSTGIGSCKLRKFCVFLAFHANVTGWHLVQLFMPQIIVTMSGLLHRIQISCALLPLLSILLIIKATQLNFLMFAEAFFI